MASTLQRYPLSSPEGTPIPLEIIKPHSFLQKSFESGVSSSQISVPEDIEIMSITCTEDCLITFGAPVLAIEDGVLAENTLLVGKYTRICTAINANTFAIRGLSANGIAHIQYIQNWAGLALQTQITMR